LILLPDLIDSNKTLLLKVQRLKDVFENIYNYKVESCLIDNRRPALPQAQANLAVANFVNLNDQEDALFIVYYAGHGAPGKEQGHLNMSGYVTRSQCMNPRSRLWTKAAKAGTHFSAV